MAKKGDDYVSLLNELIRGSRRTFHGPAIAKLKGERNAIPVISMKEEEIETNEWRGKGFTSSSSASSLSCIAKRSSSEHRSRSREGTSPLSPMPSEPKEPRWC